MKVQFEEAKKVQRRAKVLLWGGSGVGKTTAALQFPGPVVIDMEGGTDLYGDAFDFHVKRTTNPDEVMAAVDWLSVNDHTYQTLVIDPITIYWDGLQRKWSEIFLQRNRSSKGHHHEYYDFQPRDWMTIKAELKRLVRRLIALDMNVVVTAREKTQYADGGFMRAIGQTFDAEKSLPYMFDCVLRLHRDPDGRHLVQTIKDRSNKLTAEFENAPGAIAALIGGQELHRDAQSARIATDEQKRQIQVLIENLNMSPETCRRRLSAYGAASFDELTHENAGIILQRLQEASEAGKEEKQ